VDSGWLKGEERKKGGGPRQLAKAKQTRADVL
jgi:hypothetical protein